MLVLLFDIMEFGIVGGYLSKLCVTLPHMSICTWIIISVTFEKVYNAPCAQTCAQSNHKDFQSINRARKKFVYGKPVLSVLS